MRLTDATHVIVFQTFDDTDPRIKLTTLGHKGYTLRVSTIKSTLSDRYETALFIGKGYKDIVTIPHDVGDKSGAVAAHDAFVDDLLTGTFDLESNLLRILTLTYDWDE